MYFGVYYAVLVSEMCIIALSVSIILKPRLKLNKYLNAFIFVLILMPLCYAKMQTAGTEWETAYMVLNNVTVFLLPCLIAFMYSGKITDKAICVVIVIGAEFLSMFVMPTVKIERNGNFYINYDSMMDFGFYIMSNYASMALMTFFTTIYKFFINKSQGRRMGMLISLFIVGQIMMTRFIYTDLMEKTDNNIQFSRAVICGITVEYLADIVFLFLTERESEQEVLRRGIRNVQRELELERVGYEALCERRSELAKLRHDYNNQLTAAQLLLEGGNKAEAGRIISGLRSKVNSGRFGED